MKLRSVFCFWACLTAALSAQTTRPLPPAPWPAGQALRQQAPSPAVMPKQAGSTAHQLCNNCHRGHKGVVATASMVAQGKVTKGNRANTADQVCLSCHEGLNVGTTLNAAPKLPPAGGEVSGHLKDRLSNRKADGYTRMVKVGSKQVRLTQACGGCHDPHGKEAGRLRTLAFDIRGQVLDRRTQSVADLCFGCHAGPEAAPLSGAEADIGKFFTRSVASGHAIGATATGRPELPSLRTSTFQGRLDCVSCHDNPDPSGARGPHTSTNVALLKAPFGREKDLARLGERVNDLCYLCHDRRSIASNQSFPFHNQHLTGFTQSASNPSKRKGAGLAEASAMLGIRSARDLRPGRGGAFMPGLGEPATCATCHASHGSLRQAALIEFDRSVVIASAMGGISFQQSGLGHGSCTLSCHGYDHVQTRY